MENKKNPSETAEKAKAVWQKTKEIWAKVCRVFSIIGKVLYHLRKPFLAAPVVVAALYLFKEAQERLPETVGILLKETGEYTYLLDRNVAAMGCMAVTAACLVLMFCSRRTIYPWVISVFSLILPVFLVITNMFPA